MALGQGLSGIRTVTPDSMVLDAGLAYANINETLLRGATVDAVATALAAGTKLGASRGGAKFDDGKKIRHVDVDGKRYPIAGFERVDEFNPTLEIELIEVTHANLVRMLGSSVEDDHEHYKEYQLAAKIDAEDYITNIAVVATHTGSDSPFILVLRKCLQVDAWSINLQDRGELGVGCKFVAHASAAAPLDSPVSLYVPIDAPAA